MATILSLPTLRRRRTGFGPADLIPVVQRHAQAALATLLAWRERARARRDLASMDERMRRDIGISRFEVLRETGKPFWRP